MSDPRANWLFILSPPRSGSTLVSVVLGAHSQVASPPELHLLRYDEFDRWREESPRAVASLCTLLEMLGQESREQAVIERFAGRRTLDIYRDVLPKAGDYRLLVDKTPAYTARDERMARVASLDPVFVWLIRHPLAIAYSHIERSRSKRGTRQPGQTLARHLWLRAGRNLREVFGRELERELRRWREVNGRIEKWLARVPASRQARLHYEALVREPEATVRDLSEQLGLELEPAMLQPQQNLPAGLAWGVGDEKIYERESIDLESVERWRERYGPGDLDRATLEMMKRLGVE